MIMFVYLLSFYGIATVFEVYDGTDMIYEMRRRKPKPTLVNLPYDIDTI